MCFVFAAHEVFAAFVVTPMEFHLSVAGGESETYTFYVRNRSEETIALKVYTGDFWIEPDGKEAFLDPGEVERSCAPWVEVTPEEFELAPDQSQAVRFKLAVPPEKKGTYWTMIFIEQTSKPSIRRAEKGEQKFSILSFQRVGVRVFQETPQSEMGEGIIKQLGVEWDIEAESLRVDLEFENKGEMLLKCKGSVEVKDEKGEKVNDIDLKEFNSYPNSTRIISSFLKEKLEPGGYSALAIIDYGAEHLVAGEVLFEIKGE